MASMTKTIQCLLLPTDERLSAYQQLFFKDAHAPEKHPHKKKPDASSKVEVAVGPEAVSHYPVPTYDREAECIVVPAGARVSMNTYFNMCSTAKWLSLTNIDSIMLELEVEGRFAVYFDFHELRDIDCKSDVWHFNEETELPIRTKVAPQGSFFAEERSTISLPLARNSYTLVGFEIEAITDTMVYGGRYTADIDESKLVPTDIALTTTTFKKEEFISRNLNMLEREIFSSEDEIANHFQVVVVDNGRTLDPKEFENDHVKVFPNNNAGGSGGFARGMIEAIRLERKPTHVLVMDDDVIILAESIRRTYSLLSMLKEEYRGCYISGAMLCYEASTPEQAARGIPYQDMDLQHEDIGYVHEDGYFMNKKGKRNLGTIDGCAANEIGWPDFEYEYAAWWYCCIPMQYVTNETLPIPFFIRGDDVEYSLRNHAQVLSLNGICVWHVGFTQKFSAQMELYQVMRNSLILQAFHPYCDKIGFIDHCKDLVHINLNELAYDYADLILDAVEDFLAGPKILEDCYGIDILNQKKLKNEKLLPIKEVYDGDVDLEKVYEYGDFSTAQANHMYDSFNGQTMPAMFVNNKTGIAPYDWNYRPEHIYMCKQVLAVNPYEGTAIMRQRNPERFREVIDRAKRVFADYTNRHAEVEREYRTRYPYLTSLEFWAKYLELGEDY